jgi:hypothetical protein
MGKFEKYLKSETRYQIAFSKLNPVMCSWSRKASGS